MKRYNVQLSKAARKYYMRLDTLRRRLLDAIFLKLERDEHHTLDMLHLIVHSRNMYRIRSGSFRILVDIHRDEKVVVIIKIAPRGDVYKK